MHFGGSGSLPPGCRLARFFVTRIKEVQLFVQKRWFSVCADAIVCISCDLGLQSNSVQFRQLSLVENPSAWLCSVELMHACVHDVLTASRSP